MRSLQHVFPQRTLLDQILKISIIPCRYAKPKKMMTKKKTSPEFALEHFDMFYRPVFGDLWPLIRISLLSPKKYCAVVNNFTSDNKVEKKLSNLGAYNIIKKATKKFKHNYNKEIVSTSDDVSSLSDDEFDNFNESTLTKQIPEMSEDYLPPNEEKNTSLYDFVPVKKVYTNKERFQMDEIQSSVYRLSDFEVPTVRSLVHTWYYDNLKVFTYNPGMIESFASPKKGENGLLEYYLMDAASILPVIALDLEVNDSVLDLCSGPGGKALTIFQTLITDNVLCNDISSSRLKRVQSIMQSYIDKSVASNLKLLDMDGRKLIEPNFNKVLVDVPCNTDRHVLMEEDNNLFKPKRSDERLALPRLQKELLIAGIQSCKPGGTIVYSTCTLSPAQNDGVIQSTLEQIWSDTEINGVVEDISYITDVFKDTFRFYDKCRYGQLVLPTLQANFGPMYMCKIKRLN